MRKPRDFDSELKAIGERAKLLQEKKLRQLGELAVATGADTLPIETLAGALLAAPEAEPTVRSEEHTSELQSLMRISYAVFCLKKKIKQKYSYTRHMIH